MTGTWIRITLTKEEQVATKIAVQNGTVEIDGVEYVPKGSQEITAGEVRIVVLQRGWVMVGRLDRDGDHCKLHDASTVRVWGTSKGLGEIASGGPTTKTVLDKCHGVVEFHALTVIASIACEESKWLSRL